MIFFNLFAIRQIICCNYTIHLLVTNIASCQLKPGDLVGVRGKSQALEVIKDSVANKSDVRKYPWLEFNADKMVGKFMAYPERENIPEKINEQLIVELYSK